MKGITVDCLKKLVTENYGADTWKEIALKAGVAADRDFKHGEDIEDELVLNLFGKTCEVGNLTMEQACDAYGAYWVGSYMQSVYPEFYVGVTTAREFLVKLDAIHAAMEKRMKNAKPPRHSYEWKDDKTLQMSYKSHRDLLVLFIGAIKGVAKHFNNQIEVRKIDAQNVEIVFLA
jgi:hypothetical protein